MAEIITFIVANYSWIIPMIVSIAWIIVRLTPTKKDDNILRIIVKIIDVIIPDNKKGGGKHKLYK